MSAKLESVTPIEQVDVRDYLAQLRKVGLGGTYCDYKTSIRVSSWNSNSNLSTLFLRIRFLELNGSLVDRVYRLAIDADRALDSTSIVPGQGYLLSAIINTGTTAIRKGAVYVILELTSTTDGLIHILSNGYLTNMRTLTWPGSSFEHSVDGQGELKTVTGTNPAAGAEISESVPTNARWRLLGVVFTLVTDITVATRTVSIILDDGTTTFFEFASTTTQAASETDSYQVNQFFTVPTDVAAIHYLPIPQNLYMLQGWRFRTSTANLQAGDNYGAPTLIVEEWLEE